MHLAMVLPLVTSVLLWGGARRVAAALPPATAVRLLTAASLVTALAIGFVLAVLAFTFLAQNAEVAERGHWSVSALRALDPISPPTGWSAAVLAAGLAAAALARAFRAAVELWAADTACRGLRGGAGDLVVVDDDDRADAYALPGVRGRVVVSTAMLRALPSQERRVLFAHEASHLAHRHHLYLVAADLAAAANPLLRPAAAAIRTGVERWADEDAATSVGDRTLAARALARAALARAATQPHSGQPRGALAITGPSVGARAQALLRPPPRPHRLLAAGLTLLIAATTASSTVTAKTTEHRFEQAQTAYPQRR